VFESKLPKALAVVGCDVEANWRQIVPEICPSIRQLLQSIRDSGQLIGVASGNLETVGWRKLEAAGLREFFTFGCFSDHCESRVGIFRRAIETATQLLGPQARTCFIGDTPADVQAAKEVGANILAVATGTFSFEELSACSPDLCVSHCGEFFQD